MSAQNSPMRRGHRSSGDVRMRSALAHPLATAGEEVGESSALAGSRDDAGDLGGGGSRGDILAAIHAQIVPRLMRSHVAEPGATALPRAPETPATLGDVDECVRLAVTSDLASMLAFLEGLAARGMSVEALFLDVISAASRQLGDDWELDRRSFADVTIGLGTLQQAVSLLGPRFSAPVVPRGFVLLVAAPGEQHTLGLSLLGEFLRRAGWGVHVAPTATEAEVVTLVASEKVDLVGITVSNTNLLKPLSRMVSAVKKVSRNPSMIVMLGGSLDLSGIATKLGAVFCADPREAVRWLTHHGEASAACATTC